MPKQRESEGGRRKRREWWATGKSSCFYAKVRNRDRRERGKTMEKGKKRDGSLSHIACVEESIILWSQMCVIHIKLSKLKGHLTLPLPSIIQAPSPSLVPLSLFLLLYTHMLANLNTLKRTRAVHWNSLTFSSYFSKGSCWKGSFLMFLQQRHSLRMQNISELPDEALWVILSDVKRGGECYLHAALMLK